MFKIVAQRFPSKSWAGKQSSFEILIGTILSQRTNDVNRDRAMDNLRRTFKITPETLARANVREIARCIKPAGLYREKAPRVKAISKILLEEYDGEIGRILEKPLTEARKELMGLPGVGYKTADILLAFAAGHPVMPVDTHITRISKRLGIVDPKASYEHIRSALENLISPEERASMHLSLIRFGRELCKAKKPLCSLCPINSLCPSAFQFN